MTSEGRIHGIHGIHTSRQIGASFSAPPRQRNRRGQRDRPANISVPRYPWSLSYSVRIIVDGSFILYHMDHSRASVYTVNVSVACQDIINSPTIHQYVEPISQSYKKDIWNPSKTDVQVPCVFFCHILAASRTDRFYSFSLPSPSHSLSLSLSICLHLSICLSIYLSI